MTKTCLVIGATGAMGRAVVEQLLANGDGWTVKMLTRNARGRRALEMVETSRGRVTAIEGDVDSEAALDDAMQGVDAVFCNTDFFATMSPLKEYRQGLATLAAAERAGVGMFVYSSLDNAAGLSAGKLPVPHYDSKAAVEGFIDLMRSEEFMKKASDGFYSTRVAVLVTGPYFENFQSFFVPQKATDLTGRESVTFTFASGGKTHPMIALADIGKFARIMLDDPAEWGGRTLHVIGEALDGAEIAASFSRATGITAQWQDLDPQVIQDSNEYVGHDLANMHRFFQQVGVRPRNAALLKSLNPDLMTFEQWLKRSGWRGEPVEVQKAPE